SLESGGRGPFSSSNGPETARRGDEYPPQKSRLSWRLEISHLATQCHWPQLTSAHSGALTLLAPMLRSPMSNEQLRPLRYCSARKERSKRASPVSSCGGSDPPQAFRGATEHKVRLPFLPL